MGANIMSDNEKRKKLNAVVAAHKADGRKAMMSVLQQAQSIYGYLPLEVQRVVAEGLGVSVAEVYGIITFYSFFTLNPKGEHQINACLGTACYVKGASKVLDAIQENLGIKTGECTPDYKFSINACRCVGACGLAPVIMIDDDVYGRLTPGEIPAILAKYKEV
ncbi:MAG: NAD(P)H-dependent oxidoreductase subunit E [Clostridia bacterium]|nr:NAD(P)H-dependent oxidoreductase subunit E [Clostridia bacterium]